MLRGGTINVLRLGSQHRMSIWDQLLLEEGLHRAENIPDDKKNWCILNQCETQQPTIVLGYSGKINKLVNIEEQQMRGVPMLRRFTGGGTVIIDHNTLFISWLLGDSVLPHVRPYPKSIMTWSGEFYSAAMRGIGVNNFELRADDYVVGDLKIGGNAQAISGKKWLHHTSFLWDFDDDSMKVLQIPEKRPTYRGSRSHSQFLQRMKDIVPVKIRNSSDTFLDEVESQIEYQFPHQHINYATVEDALEILEANPNRRKTTRFETV